MTNNINIASKTKILSICLQSTVTLLTGVLGAHALALHDVEEELRHERKNSRSAPILRRPDHATRAPVKVNLNISKTFLIH